MAITYLSGQRIQGESGLTSITSEVTDYIRVADNAVKFTVTRGSNHTGYQDTSLTSSSANWVLLLKFKVDIRTETGNDSGYFVFSSSTNNQDGVITGGNSIGLGFNNRTSGESAAHGKIQVQAGNSSGYNLAIDANSLQFSDGTTSHTKWFKIIKNGDTVNLTIHDSEADAFSSTLTSGSDTATFTNSTAGAFTNLRYLKWYNETTGSATGSNNYYSGIKLYDNVTSISSSDTPTKKYIFVDDKDSVTDVPLGSEFEQTDNYKSYQYGVGTGTTNQSAKDSTSGIDANQAEGGWGVKLFGSHTLVGKKITSITTNMRQTASGYTEQTITLMHYGSTSATVRATGSTMSSDDLTGSFLSKTFTFSNPVTIQAGDYILFTIPADMGTSGAWACEIEDGSPESDAYFATWADGGSFYDQTGRALYYSTTYEGDPAWVERGTAI